MVRAVDERNDSHREFLEHLFRIGVEHCHPGRVLPPLLPKNAPKGRNIILGAGKAAAEMAAVAHKNLVGRTQGLVVTRYGHNTTASTGNIEIVEAGHPVPDTQSFEVARRMLDLASSASPEDRVLFLISGGGSALLCSPVNGVTPQQKRDVTKFLLASGAGIDEINCVRKHLSSIKGGGLAHKASAAELLTIAISDVVGDNLSDIASGPSIPFVRDVDKAIRILEKYDYPDVTGVAEPMRNAEDIYAPVHSSLVAASAKTAIDAIADHTSTCGWTPVVVGEDIEGIAAEVGREHAALARKYLEHGEPTALISGGELTVKVSNRAGRGGPNLEYLTGLMIGLESSEGIEAIACDSDGIDGSEDNAGGYVCSSSLRRAAVENIDPQRLLASNNTYMCFSALGDLIVTGPTGTNVNDIRIILINPERQKIR